MIEQLPVNITLLFIVTTLLTVYFFYKAARDSKTAAVIILSWMLLQAIIALTGFYTVTNTLPPRFALMIAPAIIFIICLFIFKRGRAFIDHLNQETLTWLHVIRIPVEIVLWLLFVNKQIPELMTFEGANYDIISGITAPFVAYFCFIKKNVGRGFMLAWNFICLALLFNVVADAALSVPSPFQQLNFNQPNRAILYFPFNWLPSCVVPIVFLSHLAAIRHFIWKYKKNETP